MQVCTSLQTDNHVSKKAIDDKFQGSVAAYLMCSGVVNNQIKKDLLLSLRVKKILISEYLAKLQAKMWMLLSLALSSSFSSVLARCAKCMKQPRSLPDIYWLKKFTHTLSSKPFLIWLLTTPPHVKYVATLPCNLSLMACFAHINVSQGSVATHARRGGIFNIHLTANLPTNLPVISFF